MRILAAMVQVACEHGVGSASVARVVGMAGVSKRTFYDLFEDREECLLVAIEQAVALAGERVSAACETQERWVDRVRAGLVALLVLFDEEPGLARLCVVESAAAGSGALACRGEVLDQLARLIDGGRAAARRQPPSFTAEGVVGGVLSVIHGRLLNPDAGTLLELANPLMSFIALPYLGGGAARIELSRPVPAVAAPGKRNGTPSPPGGLDMRLTYRTMSVLVAIASRPGLSNSEVSVRAGITDQGQISKLLGRLARVGLVENTGDGRSNGVAKAWRLTCTGEQVERAIRRESLGTGSRESTVLLRHGETDD
jgi:AcrR family transcriptional regulator